MNEIFLNGIFNANSLCITFALLHNKKIIYFTVFDPKKSIQHQQKNVQKRLDSTGIDQREFAERLRYCQTFS